MPLLLPPLSALDLIQAWECSGNLSLMISSCSHMHDIGSKQGKRLHTSNTWHVSSQAYVYIYPRPRLPTGQAVQYAKCWWQSIFYLRLGWQPRRPRGSFLLWTIRRIFADMLDKHFSHAAIFLLPHFHDTCSRVEYKWTSTYYKINVLLLIVYLVLEI